MYGPRRRSEALVAAAVSVGRLRRASLVARVVDRDGARGVRGEDGAERRDLVLEVRHGRLERLVVAGEELDLGLEVREPRLLALATLEGGWKRWCC